ncbi:OmpH family outer membrane protein [Marinobacterium rhizophilum]|uniref:OmpH family outer membrane protein n=1 Tax=Marinobacterium rhizophilum TaxID=420402 RepID=A0ABY5HFD9_9GAMM|nr:OmpH family outer membrane protein [Marinobacterium rhizophilum]UTW10293.1 OmpH family outer membrane protein [Marinobacterium rhizophilum]
MNVIRGMLLVLVAVFSLQAAAESIAVLSVEEALLKSSAAASFREELKRELASEEKQVVEMEKQAKGLQDKLRKNQGLQSSEDAKQLALQFQKAYGQYQKMGQELQQKRAERERAFLTEMRPKLDQVIRELIKQKGFDVVLAKQATVFIRSELDITPLVIEQLNKL